MLSVDLNCLTERDASEVTIYLRGVNSYLVLRVFI